jgi:hypothetical protein
MTKFIRPSLEIPVTAVEKYFFTPLYFPRSSWTVLGWWESRRPLFNVCVGGAGLVTLGTVTFLSYLPPHPIGFSVPWGPILLYGLMANVGYTLGPLGDLLLRKVLGDRAPAIGPVLFRYGFVFSVGLTLLPVPLAALGWLFRLFSS